LFNKCTQEHYLAFPFSQIKTIEMVALVQSENASIYYKEQCYQYLVHQLVSNILVIKQKEKIG